MSPSYGRDAAASSPSAFTVLYIIWTREQGKGRVFTTVLGHYSNTFDDPLFRILILRGMAWAAGEPPGRFRGLVMDGATLAPER